MAAGPRTKLLEDALDAADQDRQHAPESGGGRRPAHLRLHVGAPRRDLEQRHHLPLHAPLVEQQRARAPELEQAAARERAALGGLPPPKVKRMRDPWKLPFKRSIAAFGPGGTSAAPTRRPSKDTNASRPTRPRRGDRLPDSVMADAPPSVFDKFKNRCFKCGGANHSTSNCPLSAKTNPTSAEQKRLTDTAKEIKRIRKRRQDYVNDKKRGRT